MRLGFYIFLLFIAVQTSGQNFALKETQIRNKQNTYLLTSAPFVDKDRFVWYATNKEGVFYRFDGKNRLEYRLDKDRDPNNNSTFISNLGWIQDRESNIWAVKRDRAYIIKPNSHTVESISLATEALEMRASIAADQSGNVWISNGSSYLIKIDPKRKLVKITHPFLQKTKKSIEIVKTLEDGRIFAKSGYNLFVIDKNGLHFSCNLQDIDKQIGSNFLLFENGKLFPKNSSGIFKYNTTSLRYVYIQGLDIQIFSNPYSGCSSDHCDWNNDVLYYDSRLFVVHDNQFFINLVDRQKKEITTADTISFKNPIAVNFNEKHSNFIWISTYEELYKLLLTPSQFKKILQFKNRQLPTRAIVSDTKNNLYIGTSDGLYVVKNGKKEPEHFFVSGEKRKHFDHIVIEKERSFLWATEGHQYFKRVDLNTHEKKSFAIPDTDVDITCMKEQAPDGLWLGTNKGLYLFNKKTGTIKRYKDNTNLLGEAPILDLVETKKGTVWVASHSGLYHKEKGGNFKRYIPGGKNLDYKDILTLYEDSNGNLWIGTNGKGVFFLDVKTHHIKNYTISQGLSNPVVCGILESKDAVWFATFYGLSRLDKEKQLFSVFYKEDGLSNNEFNLRSGYMKNDSAFYFGGLDGVIEFNPEKIGDVKKHAHQIFFISSQYYSEGKSKNVINYNGVNEAPIELPYDKNYFSATFAVNELFYNENTYFYKIDGLTAGWVNAGTSGSVMLYSLPPGNYVVQIKGKDIKGIETHNEIRIPIKVRQVFYKSVLFITLVTLATGCLIAYLLIRRIRKQRKKFEREKEIIRREKEIIELRASTLKSQMNPHFVFNILNNMQSVLILEGELEVNKYFVAFSRLLRLTLDMSKQELVTLKDEIDYITYYLLLSSMQFNDELNYTIAIDDSVGNTSALLLPGMLIQPFVENAVIHGLPKVKEKKLEIRFFTENGYLVTIIKDNGIGRAASAKVDKKNMEAYKSWATTIVNERITIMNKSYMDSIILQINDMEENGVPTGTMVTLKFRIQTNKI